ncbi:MAG: phage tail tube protein [Bacteroidales bacterium]
MATDVTGYNILLKIDYDGTSKYLGGVTDENFTINARTKERIRKEDNGIQKVVKTGYDVEFSINGVSEINESGDETTRLDKTDMIDMMMDVVNQELDYVYGPKSPSTGDITYTGTLLVMSYAESTNADGEATFTLNCRGNSGLTKVEES